MLDAVLWAGIVMLAGAFAALGGRAFKLPAASGALLGGFILVSALRGSGLIQVWPHLGLIRSLLVALLCFLLGTEIDLTRLVKGGRSILVTGLAEAAAVLVLVSLAAVWLGLGGREALALGAAAIAASPTALIAVSSEARARGDLANRILTLAPLSLLLAMLAICLVLSQTVHLLGLAASLAAGAVGGAVLLVPLSRMATRGAILAAASGGAILLVGAATRVEPSGAYLVPMSVAAGFMAGNLIPNRELIREALRDLAFPCAIALFAIAGSTLLREDLSAGFFAALLVLAARSAALLLVGILGRGRSSGLREAAALTPMAGVASAGATALLLAGSAPLPETALIFLAAAFLSEAAGMVLTRWALIRSGEATAFSDSPDAWRSQMR